MMSSRGRKGGEGSWAASRADGSGAVPRTDSRGAVSRVDITLYNRDALGHSMTIEDRTRGPKSGSKGVVEMKGLWDGARNFKTSKNKQQGLGTEPFANETSTVRLNGDMNGLCVYISASNAAAPVHATRASVKLRARPLSVVSLLHLATRP